MVDWLSSDKGWSLEYTDSLTWRQIMTLWSRLWKRREINARIDIKLSPFYSGKEDRTTSVDATQDDGVLDQLASKGLPIKTM